MLNASALLHRTTKRGRFLDAEARPILPLLPYSSAPNPRATRKQQILVIRNRPLEADPGLAVWSPQRQNSRSVVGSAILVRRARTSFRPLSTCTSSCS